jgi:hypothetical protein
MGTAARTAVIAGTATAVSGNVAAKQQAKANQAAAAPPPPAPVAQAPAPAAEPAAAPQLDVVRLKELAELRDQGILTEEEFAAQKARLLG